MADSLRKSDVYFGVTLIAATVVFFWPVLAWIAGETLAHEQLRQSLALMFFAAVYVAFDQWSKLKPVFEISNRNLGLLFAAFLVAATALVFPIPYTVLGALALALFALARIVFGSKALPVYLPFAVTFGAFLLFILFFPMLDWPLRTLAGTAAAGLLDQAGLATALTLHQQPDPILLLKVDEQIFKVAAECNGFGLMSTSTLLALLLIVSRAMPLWWKVSGVLLAAVAGFLFNVVRIIGIVLAAPYFPEHYDLMHEAVGLTALFAGLAVVWLLIGAGNGVAAPPADGTERP